MKTYDLNMKNGVQLVETTLQYGAYKGKILRLVHGNCFGRHILNIDFECEDADVQNDCHLQFNEDCDMWSADLHDADGNIHHVEEDSVTFGNLVVKTEIIKQCKSFAAATKTLLEKETEYKAQSSSIADKKGKSIRRIKTGM